MKIDLKALSIADPEGTLDEAFAVLRDELLPVTYRTLSGNELRIWAAGNATSYLNLKAAADTNVAAEMAYLLVGAPDSILELGKPDVMGLVDGLASANVIEAAGKAALLTMAEVHNPKWPQLKIGHLATARRMLSIADADPRSGTEPILVREPKPDKDRTAYDAYKLLFDAYIVTVAGDVSAIKAAHDYPNLSVSELRSIRSKRDQERV